MAGADLDLLQGTLDVLVLKALSWGPRHGYAVAQWIRDRTSEDLRVEDGALYTALHRMERRRFLKPEWGITDTGRRAKYYQLTTAGREELSARAARWTTYANAVFRVLRTAEAQ
jgi:transcriptional regulator